MNQRQFDVLNSRLTRVESKIARGFEELGIGVNTEPDWLTVDDSARVLYLSTLGRSLQVILSDAKRRGATQMGKVYTIVHRGAEVGTVMLAEVV